MTSVTMGATSAYSARATLSQSSFAGRKVSIAHRNVLPRCGGRTAVQTAAFFAPKRAQKIEASARPSAGQPRGLGHLAGFSLPRFRKKASEDPQIAHAGGGGGGDGGGSGGGGGGGGGDGNGEGDEKVSVDDCEKYGVKADSLPADMSEALARGDITAAILTRYATLMKNPLLAVLMRNQGFRMKMLADPGFIVKIYIELGIGMFTKSAAEYEKRKGNFTNELDFVLASVIMALIADLVLVWLPAPSLAWAGASKGAKELTKIQKYLKNCPKNAFQKVPAGVAAYSLPQRVMPVLANGSKLMAVGFFASNVGVGVTNMLIWARQQMDPSWKQLNPPQSQLKTSLAYASYMASSSNLRYQVVAGVIEERIVEVVFPQPAVRGALSTIIRTLNTFLGSLMWVDYVRFLGLQKKHDD